MKKQKKKVGPAQKPAPRSASAHQVRIIGGLWKRTPLPVLTAEGLRPTPDRVRETVFNWLNHLLDGDWARVHCLDLFAGSGALGFEAASRGAAQVTLVEQNAAAVHQLQQVKVKLDALQVTVVRSDSLRYVKGCAARNAPQSTAPANMPSTAPSTFNLIFVDPPYQLQLLEQVLPLCLPLLAPDGWLYLESAASLLDADSAEEPPLWLQEWDIIRADRAGMVFYHLLQRKKTPRNQA